MIFWLLNLFIFFLSFFVRRLMANNASEWKRKQTIYSFCWFVNYESEQLYLAWMCHTHTHTVLGCMLHNNQWHAFINRNKCVILLCLLVNLLTLSLWIIGFITKNLLNCSLLDEWYAFFLFLFVVIVCIETTDEWFVSKGEPNLSALWNKTFDQFSKRIHIHKQAYNLFTFRLIFFLIFKFLRLFFKRFWAFYSEIKWKR